VWPFKRKLLRSTSERCCLLGPTSWFNFWHPSVDKIPKCTVQIKTVEQYSVVVLFSMLYKVILTFETKSKILAIQLKAFKHNFRCFLYTEILTLETVNKISNCDHSSESSWAVLLSGAVYLPIFHERNLAFFPVSTLANFGIKGLETCTLLVLNFAGL